MSYKTKSIIDIVRDIESNKLFLPAIQRKFVWKQRQIELLFDSIMRNFPIGTFLFWNLDQCNANNYVFYEFLKAYDVRDPYNKRKTGAFLFPEVIGVLDGQQRLSSIYIGLQGTHTEKTPNKRKNNDDAYLSSELYLNILSLPYFISENDELEIDEERNFEFRFLTKDESEGWVNRKSKKACNDGQIIEQEENMFWFKVGEVLKWSKDPEIDKIYNGFR